MAELFGRDVKTIGKHINNALKEELDTQEVVAKIAGLGELQAIRDIYVSHARLAKDF